MIAVGLVVAGVTLLAGVGAALLLGVLPTVRLQLVGLALVAVVLPLTAVTVSGLVMFHMGGDLAVLEVSAAAATAVLVGALLTARTITSRLQRVREASGVLSSGELTARAPTGGPAELAELAESFNAMAANLQEFFDARRTLLAWASHDLRAPLTSLQAMLESVADGVVPLERYLGPMQSQVRLLGTLIDDLFELARIDAGVLAVAAVSVDVGALVGACLGEHEAAARAKGITLSVSLRDPCATARADPDKVRRVVDNLVANALRFTPPHGRVAASVTAGPGSVLVAIEDTGPGIAETALDRVFDPFWRDDPARSPGEGGAGLGLAIARGLIEAQGGRIWVELPPSGGTRLCFILPAAETPASVPETLPQPVRPSPAAGSARRRGGLG